MNIFNQKNSIKSINLILISFQYLLVDISILKNCIRINSHYEWLEIVSWIYSKKYNSSIISKTLKLEDHIKMYLNLINSYFVQIYKFKVLYTVGIYSKNHLKSIVLKKIRAKLNIIHLAKFHSLWQLN